MYIVFSSCGNDSVALIQYLYEQGINDVHVAYSDTQWAAEDWRYRVDDVMHWVHALGYAFTTISTMGFEEVCRKKKAFPMNGKAFCSYMLKIEPAREWLDIVDADKEATCCVGIRRCESQKRAQWPEWVEESENHGGRELWSPLVRHTDEMRDELIKRAGFDVLPHRSMECSPCVNASKADLRLLKMVDIEKVERLEAEIDALKKNDGERFMFRSKKCGGAQGIRQVVDWANSGHGKYDHDQLGMFSCESGFCGD